MVDNIQSVSNVNNYYAQDQAKAVDNNNNNAQTNVTPIASDSYQPSEVAQTVKVEDKKPGLIQKAKNFFKTPTGKAILIGGGIALVGALIFTPLLPMAVSAIGAGITGIGHALIGAGGAIGGASTAVAAGVLAVKNFVTSPFMAGFFGGITGAVVGGWLKDKINGKPNNSQPQQPAQPTQPAPQPAYTPVATSNPAPQPTYTPVEVPQNLAPQVVTTPVATSNPAPQPTYTPVEVPQSPSVPISQPIATDDRDALVAQIRQLEERVNQLTTLLEKGNSVSAPDQVVPVTSEPEVETTQPSNIIQFPMEKRIIKELDRIEERVNLLDATLGKKTQKASSTDDMYEQILKRIAEINRRLDQIFAKLALLDKAA